MGRIPIINPDDIAQKLPRINERLDERRAGEAALKERAQRLAARESFAIETTLSGHGPMSLMRQARAAGYKVNLVFVGLDEPELSIIRIADRVALGGHDVPPDAVVRRYDDAMSRLANALAISDRCYVLDNSGERRRLLFVREDERTRFAARDIPASSARSAIPEYVWNVAGGGEYAQR